MLPGAHGKSWHAMIHAALIPMGDWCDLHGTNVNHLMKNLDAVSQSVLRQTERPLRHTAKNLLRLQYFPILKCV